MLKEHLHILHLFGAGGGEGVATYLDRAQTSLNLVWFRLYQVSCLYQVSWSLVA